MRHHDQHREPDRQAPAGVPEGTEDVLSAISAVEHQLASLKKAAAERKERDAQLLARETELADREAAFDARVAEIERDLAIIEQTRGAINREREEAAAEAEAARSEVEHAKAELASRLSALHERESGLANRQRSIEESTARLEKLEAETAERSGRLEARARELEQAEAKLTDRVQELTSRLEAMEQEAREASDRASIAEERAELAERELEAARARRKQAEDAIRILEASLAKAQEESTSIFTSVEQSETEIVRLTREIHALEERVAELSGERDRSGSELGEAQARCEQLERETAERLAAIESQLGGAEARAEAAERRAAEHRARVEALESEADELAAQLEEARSAVASSADGDASGQHAHIDELEHALEDREAAIAERDEVIAGLQSKLATATEKITQFGEFIKTQMPSGGGKSAAAAAQARVAELQSQLDAVTAERDQLTRRLAERPAPAAPSTDSGLELRRERLSRMRKQLRQQGRKIRRANELLQDRFAQCEGLLSRRAELAAAHQAIVEQRQRARSHRATTTAAGAMVALVIMAAVLLGLSWIAAEKVNPGEYAAVATIAADGGERVLSESALQEWQQYHEQIFADPRFIESLADMFKRRGLGSLGTPAAVQQALDEGLMVTSPSDGQLQLEFRGTGSTRTERTLDTLAVAVARTANRTRSRRTDGALSVVSVPAEVGEDPIAGDRLTWTLAIFGGGLCFSLTFGAVVWKRMASAKSTFEHDQQLQALLSEARWQDPRIDIDAQAEAETVPPVAPQPSRRGKRTRKPR